MGYIAPLRYIFNEFFNPFLWSLKLPAYRIFIAVKSPACTYLISECSLTGVKRYSCYASLTTK